MLKLWHKNDFKKKEKIINHDIKTGWSHLHWGRTFCSLQTLSHSTATDLGPWVQRLKVKGKRHKQGQLGGVWWFVWTCASGHDTYLNKKKPLVCGVCYHEMPLTGTLIWPGLLLLTLLMLANYCLYLLDSKLFHKGRLLICRQYYFDPKKALVKIILYSADKIHLMLNLLLFLSFGPNIHINSRGNGSSTDPPAIGTVVQWE